MPYSIGTTIEKPIMTDPTPQMDSIVLPIQGNSDTVCTNAYVERGPLPLGTEGLTWGLRMVGNPATHVAGFTKVPTSSGDHWYIAKN